MCRYCGEAPIKDATQGCPACLEKNAARALAAWRSRPGYKPRVVKSLAHKDDLTPKTCTKCLETKPRGANFYPTDGKPDGFASFCNACINADRAARKRGERTARTGLKFFQHCIRCHLWQPRSEVNSTSYCRPCLSALRKEQYVENREVILRSMQTAKQRLRREMATAYGGVCECCGEHRWQLLTIDHVDGGGKQHVKSLGGPTALYRWLKKHGWPREGLGHRWQILCFNCNCGRERIKHVGKGECPHKVPQSPDSLPASARTSKLCPRCGIVKSIATDFYRLKGGKVGPYCKKCGLSARRERLRALANGEALPDDRSGLGYLKHCPRCKLFLVAHESFNRNKQAHDGWQGRCRGCAKEERLARKEKNNATARETDQALRREVIAAYGGKCACCGLDDWRFLTIDHIFGDGAEERKQFGVKIYARLERLGFPKGRHRVLCYSCNCCRGKFGACVHELER